MFVAGAALMYVGDRLLLRYVFPWALVSLIVIGTVAALWGTKPAIFVLILSACFSDLIVPDLRISYFYSHDLSWHMRLMRSLLFAICGIAAIWMIHQSRISQEQADKKKAVVESLQRMILPETIPNVPGFEISAIYRPANYDEGVGGDFYDCFPIRKNLYGLLIGDVMGKGKEAAVCTALLRYSVRAYANLGMTPGQILHRVNEVIENQELNFKTATLFVGLLDCSSNKLYFSLAGHEPPLMQRANGCRETLNAGGTMLGVGLDLPYEEGCVELKSGDHLLFMTDGVTEARDSRGQFLGSEGASRLLALSAAESTSQKIIARIDTELSWFTGGIYRDDVAMLLVTCTSES